METFDSNEYDDELDQIICDEYFPQKMTQFSLFDTDSECQDLLDTLEMYQEAKYFLHDFLNASFIAKMQDFFIVRIIPIPCIGLKIFFEKQPWDVITKMTLNKI